MKNNPGAVQTSRYLQEELMNCLKTSTSPPRHIDLPFSLHLPLWPELDKSLLQSKEPDDGTESNCVTVPANLSKCVDINVVSGL